MSCEESLVRYTTRFLADKSARITTIFGGKDPNLGIKIRVAERPGRTRHIAGVSIPISLPKLNCCDWNSVNALPSLSAVLAIPSLFSFAVPTC